MKQSKLVCASCSPFSGVNPHRLLGLSFLLSSLSLPAMGERLDLKANAAKVLPLEVKTEQYWVGQINTDKPISIQLLDGDKTLLRAFPAKEGKQALHLVLKGTGEQLVLQGDEDLAVDLIWQKYPLTNKTQFELSEPLLAPVVDAVNQKQDWKPHWQALKQKGMPLITDVGDGQYRVTFIYQGAKHNVRLWGGPSSDHESLYQLPGTDLWYRSFTVPAATRLSYKLAPDVPEFEGDPRSRRVAILATAQRDPLNPKVFPEGDLDAFQQSSVLELPGAPAQPGSDIHVELRGKLTGFDFHSQLLHNKRRIDLYQTSNFSATAKEKWLLIAFDGIQYQKQINTPAIVEHLSSQGLIPPVQLVLIDAIDNDIRGQELPDNPTFGRMLIEELLPEVRKRTGASFSANQTILTGSSYGGLASLQLAWRHPKVFGKVIAKSPSLWWDQNGQAVEPGYYLLSERFLKSKRLPLDIFISAGLFEAAHGGQGDKGILDGSRNLRDVLRAKGYPLVYREYAAGHDYLAWRGAVADGLLALRKMD